MADYLKDRTDDKRIMRERVVFELFVQIALGLDYMHYKHTVNKDMRLDHIYHYINAKGQVRLKIGSYYNGTVKDTA